MKPKCILKKPNCYWMSCGISLVIIFSNLASISCSFGADIYCGPRVAQHVLRHYGHEIELVELVNRMQFEREKGCSFSDLQSELSRHGVNSVTLKVTDWSSLTWDEPVVLHQWPSGPHNSLGHFVVLITRGNQMYLWGGLNGERRIKSHELSKLTSGFSLITSARPIEAPRFISTIPVAPQTASAYLLSFMIAGMALALLAPSVLWSKLKTANVTSHVQKILFLNHK